MNNRKLVKAMKERGWEVETTNKGHLKFIHASGQHIIHGSSPSCSRAEKNHWATVRRIEEGRADMRQVRQGIPA